MPQSHAQVYLHIVFSTKHHRPQLQDTGVREGMYAYVVGICRNLECPTVAVGDTEDHIHILCCLSRNIALRDLLQEMKRSSSSWVRSHFVMSVPFQWQAGYGAFSVSPGDVDDVAVYIHSQEAHHHTVDFQDELRGLLRQYNIACDERYLWD